MEQGSSLHGALQQFIAQERLPPGYLSTVKQWFLPLAEQILRRAAGSRQALLVGVSGCQGSGKSTLAALLVLLARELLGLRAVNLSIDDFYLGHAERQVLARKVHPLLATRGVPGTHEVPLAMATIAALRGSGEVAIPRFDKAVDDRMPREAWPRLAGPVDLIVLEGWCLAVGPQGGEDLFLPINELEQREDPDGRWRRHVNDCIAREYLDWYAMLDFLVMLQAPDFSRVYAWRQKQEEKLAASHVPGQSSKVMNPAQLRRFIQHYERLTRHGLATLPEQADVVFRLDDEQGIAGKVKG